MSSLMKVLSLMKFLLVTITSCTALPNIIWIMADDLGWGEPGSFPAGSIHGRIDTPNLDNLAAQGMRFTNAYAGYTVCAPSRTTLFTGRHSGKFKQYDLPGTSLSPGTAVTTAEILKKAGYTTALIGKSAPLTQPLQQGFDYFFGQIDQVKCHNMYPKVVDMGNLTGNVNLSLNYKQRSRDLCMASPLSYNYTTDMFQTRALRWIENAATNTETPFFLYLSFTVPHAGGWGDTNKESGAPVPKDGRYANQTTWPDVEKDHAGVITYLDGYVGQVMSAMKQLMIEDNTVLFFASDNGAHLEGGHSYTFFNSTGGLKGHKRSMYEGGMRSPSIVQWTGTIESGSVSDYPWSFWDFMPTVAEIAGAEDEVPKDIDGHSILPTLKGDGTQPPPTYLYFTGNSGWGNKRKLIKKDMYWGMHDDSNTRNAVTQQQQTTAYSFRVGNWKAVVNDCIDTPRLRDTMQLYDLSIDPFELNDLGKINKGQVKRMKTFIINKNVSCACYQC